MLDYSDSDTVNIKSISSVLDGQTITITVLLS